MEKTTGIPDGLARYAQLSEEQYAQGVELAISSGLGVEYGERFQPPNRPLIRNPWGRYITVTSGDVAALEALLESLDG